MPPWSQTQTWPFLLHTLIETPAATSFLLAPQSQLPWASAEAQLILRSYGALLASTVMLSAGFALRTEYDDAAYVFSLAMAFYHLFPTYRAYARMDRQMGTRECNKVLGGPRVHFWVHVVCFVSFVGFAATSKLYPAIAV